MIQSKQLIVFLFILLGFNITMAFTQDKISIAVLDLDSEGLSNSEARIISARLRTDLFNTNKFLVLERDKMDKILQEQGFQLSGCTSNDCVVEVGKLTGVEQIVAGNIGLIGKLYTLTIRLIDVESGHILNTATEDCECSIETVLTKSVRNVAKILSGETVLTSNYTNISNDNISPRKDELTEWEEMGISREEWILFKRSGLSKEIWLKQPWSREGISEQDWKYKKFEKESKSPSGAYFRSLILPGLGQYYVGHTARGILYTSLFAYGVVLVIFGAEQLDPIMSDVAILTNLAVAFGIAYIISPIDAAISAKSYNNKIKQKYSISFKYDPTSLNATSVIISYKF